MQRALKVLMTTLSLTACLTASAFAGGSGGLEQDPASGYQCIAFEHRDYKGHTMSATAGNGWKCLAGNGLTKFHIQDCRELPCENLAKP